MADGSADAMTEVQQGQEQQAQAQQEQGISHDQAYNALVNTWERAEQTSRVLNESLVYLEQAAPDLADGSSLRPTAEAFATIVQAFQEELTIMAGTLGPVSELQAWAEWADTELQRKQQEESNTAMAHEAALQQKEQELQASTTSASAAIAAAEANASRAEERAAAAEAALSSVRSSSSGVSPDTGFAAEMASTKAELEAVRAELRAKDSSLETANTELAQIKLSLAQVAVAPASTEDVEATLKKTEKQLHAAKAALASAKRENLSLRDHETKLNDQVAQLQANIHELAAELKAQQSQKSKSDQVRPDVAILQNTIKRLQRDLEAARIQERDMQELLESEQKKQLQLQQSLQETLVAQAATSPTGGSPGRNGRPFTAPIRDSLDVLKTMRRNQTLINEVTSQRFENDRLRSDNASLLLHVKDATRASSDLHNQVATSYAHRMELQRRLFKTQSEKKLWEAQLNKTAARTIRRHQLIKEADEEYQWTQIEVMQNRSNSGKTSFGKNTGVPRGTRNIQVDKWSNMNTIEM